MIFIAGAPSVALRYPIASRRKAMSRKKNRRKNATVDLSVQRTRIVVKMNHPTRKNPNALVKSLGSAPVGVPSAAFTAYAAWIPKPPGVRTIAKEIQNPPYEERAVAPKVFPTAISLFRVRIYLRKSRDPSNGDLPHASKQLNKTTISESQSNNNIGFGDATCATIDKRQNEGGKGKSAESERSWVGKLPVRVSPIKTWLEFTSESWQSSRVSSVGVCERVSAIVVALAMSGILAVYTSGVVCCRNIFRVVIFLIQAACLGSCCHCVKGCASALIIILDDGLGGCRAKLMCSIGPLCMSTNC